MTSAADLKQIEEEKKLENAKGKVREVLANEPFGMSIEQLTGKCRYSIKYCKSVLACMPDVMCEHGYYLLAEVAKAALVAEAEKAAQAKDEEIEKEISAPVKIVVEPSPKAKVKKTGISEGKMSEVLLSMLRAESENGVDRDLIIATLGVTRKQLSNTILRLRRDYHIQLIGNSYKLDENCIPMPVSAQVKERNAVFGLVGSLKGKIESRVTRRAELSTAEIENILRTVTGLSDVQWTNDGVVLTQVEVA